MVEVWDEQPTIRIACKLDNDLGIDLRKRANVIDWGEAATNPSGVEMRSR